MKLSLVKYWFVFICLFCMMEKTGISAISMLSHIKVMVTELQTSKEANDSGESSEAKQVEVKEYWALSPDDAFLMPVIAIKPIQYPREISQLHYNWCPPVPTPPPNFNV
jgi:hypothetical protein